VRAIFVGLTTFDIIQYVGEFPGPDAKVEALGSWMGAGGPAANAAITFAALGGRAQLITALGGSFAAIEARRDLEALGVHVDDRALEGSCAISNVVVDAAGRRTVVSTNAGGLRRLRAGGQPIGDAEVVLSDGHHAEIALPVLDQAVRLGTPVLLDAGTRRPATDGFLSRSTHVIASAAFAVGRPPEIVARELLRPPVRLAAVTAGGRAIVAMTHDGIAAGIAVPAVQVVDTLGAGDVLHGAFAYHLAAGTPPLAALRCAAATASQSCTHRGPRIDRSAGVAPIR
jgi:sugar/nucleoside kinase (ribokinase family)